MSHVFKELGNSFVLDQKANIQNELPANIYTISIQQQIGIVFTPLNIVKDDLIRVPNSVADETLDFIKNFTSDETKLRYKNTKVTHKTAILFEGPAGSGKTGSVNMIIDELIKQDAIVFFDADPSLVASVLPAVREQNPNKLICVVYEEFDEWLQDDHATINSFLDGQLSVNNMIVLATTNYIEKIPSRIKNRPSRFQLVKHVGLPSDALRRAWYEQKLTDIGHADKIEEFVQASTDMSMDQMKDLIVSHLALNIPLHEVVQKLQIMSDNAVGIDDYVSKEQVDVLSAKDLRKLFSLPRGLNPIKDPWGKK